MPIAAYFWTILGLVVAGLLIGCVLHRPAWSLIGLVPVATLGLIAFAGSHAGLHDNVGRKTWTPTAPAAAYRMGMATLDLRRVDPAAGPRVVRVTAGAGQVRVLVPRDADIAVQRHVHLGQVTIREPGAYDGNGGFEVSRTLPAPSDATGPHVVVDVHLADGQVLIERR